MDGIKHDLCNKNAGTKKRNGLLEIYRLFFCFWVMHHHNFFFFENTGKHFNYAQLAVEFFFVLSGFYLIRSMRKLKDCKVLTGMKDIVWTKIKPLFFSLCFIASFNMICMALFIKENQFDALFKIFRYWWYLLYLAIAIGILYLIYRLIKNEKLYALFLAVLMISMWVFHYALEERSFFIYEFTFVARTFGGLSLGMLISYIPSWKTKFFNINIVAVALLIPLIFYLAYNDKDYWIYLGMIGLFAALVHFTSNISFGGRVFNFIGQLSTRMYVYMSFVTTLYLLGLTNHRVLFVIDLSLSVMDIILSTYRQKYKKLKQESEKAAVTSN